MCNLDDTCTYGNEQDKRPLTATKSSQQSLPHTNKSPSVYQFVCSQHFTPTKPMVWRATFCLDAFYTSHKPHSHSHTLNIQSIHTTHQTHPSCSPFSHARPAIFTNTHSPSHIYSSSLSLSLSLSQLGIFRNTRSLLFLFTPPFPCALPQQLINLKTRQPQSSIHPSIPYQTFQSKPPIPKNNNLKKTGSYI